ncbi:MAG: hypothetical protein OEU26_18420, partial [Candidatus Tectomicrobia bacterium]|nr:hypothetical protein [Candidatus Tectomicrobia bacterium]
MSDRRPIRFDDLMAHHRCQQPRITPDAQSVVFVATHPDVSQNRNLSHLYRVPLAGGDVVQLTQHGSTCSDPAISPDGRWIAFTSNRQGDTSQVWLLPVDGGEAHPVTDLYLGARRPVWTPDGAYLLVISPVYRDSNDPDEIVRRETERPRGEVRPRLIDDLMFRHWDEWTEDRIDHLFSIDIHTGAARDLSPGPYPVPPRSLTGEPDYAVCVDGSEICFVSLRDPDQARSTNSNLWIMAAAGGASCRISPREGCNAYPVYSPGGDRIAYCGMRRSGYEADRRELLVFDRASGETREVAPGFDRSVEPPVWSPDSEFLFFAAQDRGATRLFRVPSAGGEPEPLTHGATDLEPVVSPDGAWLVFQRQTSTAPPEICRTPVGGGGAEALTTFNADRLAALDLHPVDDFWYTGAKAARVHGFLLKPPG